VLQVGPCEAHPDARLAPDPPPMPPGTVLRPSDPADPYGEWVAVCKKPAGMRPRQEAAVEEEEEEQQQQEEAEQEDFIDEGEVVVYRCGYKDLRLSISCKFQCECTHELCLLTRSQAVYQLAISHPACPGRFLLLSATRRYYARASLELRLAV
jgi:hypothetical protein